MYSISLLPQYPNGFPNFTWANTKTYDFKTLAFVITKQVWAGALFKEIEHPRKNKLVPYRNKENFLQKATIELDYDDGLELSEAMSALAPYKHIIGTTKSHRLQKTTIIFDSVPEREVSKKVVDAIVSIKGFVNTKYNQTGSKIEIRSPEDFKVEYHIPRLKQICEEQGLKVVEMKHESARDRFRVVLFLNEVITDQRKHRPTIEEFLKSVGLPEPDPASYNAVCFFYPLNELFSVEEQGQLVSVVEPKEPPREYVRPILKEGQKGQLRRGTQNFLLNGLDVGAKEGVFFTTFTATCYDLAENNFPLDEAIELLRKVPHTMEYSHHKFEAKYRGEIERIYSKVAPLIQGENNG